MPSIGLFCSFLFEERSDQRKIFCIKLVAFLLDGFPVSASVRARKTSARLLSKASNLIRLADYYKTLILEQASLIYCEVGNINSS